jgi:uncharacterized protein YprB with RNaseH-like and TPR domain
MLIGFDIETDTSGVCPDGERTGLDPRYTRVISAAVWSDLGGEFFVHENEQTLLRQIDSWFRATANVFPGGTVLTWNGANFDLPFILTRSQINGIIPGLTTRVSPARPPKYRTCPGYDGGLLGSWYGLDHVDLMYAYKEYAEAHGIRQGLKPVAKELGFDPIEVDASVMQALSDEELREYNLSDVRVTHSIGQVTNLGPWRDSLTA